MSPVDYRVRVWRPRNTAFLQEHIVCTTAFGGAGVTVWGCLSLNCKLDLYVIDAYPEIEGTFLINIHHI